MKKNGTVNIFFCSIILKKKKEIIFLIVKCQSNNYMELSFFNNQISIALEIKMIQL